MRIGPEWRGKLLPGEAEVLAGTLRNWRESGLVTHVEILGPGDCPVAAAAEGVLYPLDQPPELPLAGCDRLPCGCTFLSVLNDEGGATARPAGNRAGLSAGPCLDSEQGED